MSLSVCLSVFVTVPVCVFLRLSACLAIYLCLSVFVSFSFSLCLCRSSCLFFLSVFLSPFSLCLSPSSSAICYTALTPMLKTCPRCRVTKEMQVSAFPVHPAHLVSAGRRGTGGTQGYRGYQAGRDHPDYLASSPSGFRALKVNTCFSFCC